MISGRSAKVSLVVAAFSVIANFACVQAHAGPPSNFRKPSNFRRKLDMREVEVDLQTSLSELLSSASPRASQRLAAIEKSIWQTFQALPKNSAGRLAPAAVRYIVHGYFAKEHGWLIKGLEPHGHAQTDVAEVHEISILQEKVPLLVEGLLEARQANRGLALSDVIAMIGALEQLMFDESVTLLEAAYHLNGLAVDEEISQVTLHRVLQSYIVLFDQGSQANFDDADLHQSMLSGRRAEIDEFEHDIVLNWEYARRGTVNPFVPRKYSFQHAIEVMEHVAADYGKWQNDECRGMKSHLSELDAEGNGRVPLGIFYAQPEGAYQFSESSDYLRQIGALDESSSSKPQVLIANYLAGPSNCIASSSYYSVCCLSECDHIFNEFEHHILAPAASPEKLLGLAQNMSDAALLPGLSEKLYAIAAQNGGEVPLHGRLFAQWLHFAFPYECPFPSVLESAAALTASQWLGADKTVVASAEEKEQHLTSPHPLTGSTFSIDEQWSEYEVLPVHESTSEQVISGVGLVRMVVQIAAILVAFRSACAAWRSVASSSSAAGKKNDDFLLPLRV